MHRCSLDLYIETTITEDFTSHLECKHARTLIKQTSNAEDAQEKG